MYFDIYREIVRLAEAGEDAAVATVVMVAGSTPREEGAKMLVYADGRTLGTVGGGNIEKQVTREALEVIKTGQAKKDAGRADRIAALAARTSFRRGLVRVQARLPGGQDQRVA